MENLNVGSPCAVRDDSGFRRGRIEATSSESSLVHVFLVDLGIYRDVKCEDLFEIDDRFLNFPEMGIRFSLADISPFRGDVWSDRAISWVKFKISEKEIIMKVSRELDCDKFEGLLYDVTTEDLSLNYLLVLEGEASIDLSKNKVDTNSNSFTESNKGRKNLVNCDNSYSCKVIEALTPTSIFVRKL